MKKLLILLTSISFTSLTLVSAVSCGIKKTEDNGDGNTGGEGENPDKPVDDLTKVDHIIIDDVIWEKITNGSFLIDKLDYRDKNVKESISNKIAQAGDGVDEKWEKNDSIHFKSKYDDKDGITESFEYKIVFLNSDNKQKYYKLNLEIYTAREVRAENIIKFTSNGGYINNNFNTPPINEKQSNLINDGIKTWISEYKLVGDGYTLDKEWIASLQIKWIDLFKSFISANKDTELYVLSNKDNGETSTINLHGYTIDELVNAMPTGESEIIQAYENRSLDFLFCKSYFDVYEAEFDSIIEIGQSNEHGLYSIQFFTNESKSYLKTLGMDWKDILSDSFGKSEIINSKINIIISFDKNEFNWETTK